MDVPEEEEDDDTHNDDGVVLDQISKTSHSEAESMLSKCTNWFETQDEGKCNTDSTSS